MKLDVFCAWGDGPDVGINLSRTEEEAKRWLNPSTFWCLDFTASEARELAAKLIQCAEQAERMDKEVAEHDKTS